MVAGRTWIGMMTHSRKSEPWVHTKHTSYTMHFKIYNFAMGFREYKSTYATQLFKPCFLQHLVGNADFRNMILHFSAR